jgi:hypothetical protein
MLFEESGIDPVVAAERGTFTARFGKDVPREHHGWLPAKPGVLFPVHTLDGGIFYRLRPDRPGRYPKYMQPKGAPNRLDVHPRQHELIKQPGGTRYLTEGEKKVDAGVSRGLLMVGVSGVFNGQRDKGKALIDDWKHLPLEGESYSIVFDSDIEINQSVQLAALRYAHLLREAGSEVFITSLPPARDGCKQGLDDFFAGGGTVEELEALTRPFDLAAVESARLSRDEEFRSAIGYLWRDWSNRDWMRFAGKAERGNWARGHTARDTKEALVRLASRSGKMDGGGIVFWAGLRRIADMAAKSAPSVSKAVKHLEADGQLEILEPKEAGQARSYRLLVTRADLYTMEGGDREGTGFGVDVRRCKGLRTPSAPRLRWSSPGSKKRREFEVVPGRQVVRHTGALPPDEQEARPYVKRLCPHRGAVIDVLEASGSELHIEALCKALHRERVRDFRRRVLPELERAGIVECEGDIVRLTGDWRDRLEKERERTEEIEQARLQAEKHREQGTRYQEHLEREKRGTPAASIAAVRRTKILRERRLREIREEEERDRAPTPPAVETFVKRIMNQNPRIRMGLLCEIARDDGLRWRDVPPAVQRMGFRIEKLPEFGNKEFVFAGRESAA